MRYLTVERQIKERTNGVNGSLIKNIERVNGRLTKNIKNNDTNYHLKEDFIFDFFINIIDPYIK